MSRTVIDFNPRAPRGARLVPPAFDVAILRISIHAPREGRDVLAGVPGGDSRYFNPRAPRGARLEVTSKYAFNKLFQSTRPARGATAMDRSSTRLMMISIHAPREGRDPWRGETNIWRWNFNPRAPRGARRNGRARHLARRDHFNPRAPRGARPSCHRLRWHRTYFNPRAPRGARLAGEPVTYARAVFQSTRPARGATKLTSGQVPFTKKFQSTRPARGATCG